MRTPKTVKGYISFLRAIEKRSVESLRGFDRLSEADKELLITIDAEISNLVNEVEL